SGALLRSRGRRRAAGLLTVPVLAAAGVRLQARAQRLLGVSRGLDGLLQIGAQLEVRVVNLLHERLDLAVGLLRGLRSLPVGAELLPVRLDRVVLALAVRLQLLPVRLQRRGDLRAVGRSLQRLDVALDLRR